MSAKSEEDQHRVKFRLHPNEYAATEREAKKRGISTAAMCLLMYRAAAAEFLDDF